MTGAQVRELRQALKMEPAHFAQLLGVHPSTLYRWEAAALGDIRVEPFQQQILAVLQNQIERNAQPSESLGDAILKGLLIGGALLGLFQLLQSAYGEEPLALKGTAGRNRLSRKRPSRPNRRLRSK